MTAAGDGQKVDGGGHVLMSDPSALAERMADYIETHNRYEHLSKRDVAVEVVMVLATDPTATVDFLRTLGIDPRSVCIPGGCNCEQIATGDAARCSCTTATVEPFGATKAHTRRVVDPSCEVHGDPSPAARGEGSGT